MNIETLWEILRDLLRYGAVSNGERRAVEAEDFWNRSVICTDCSGSDDCGMCNSVEKKTKTTNHN